MFTLLSAARVAALSVTLGLTAGAQAAFYYEARTTTDAGSAGTVLGWVDGERARIEFRDGDPSGMFPAGSYMLSQGGGVIYVVNPAERTISEVDFAQIFQFVGAIVDATGGLVRMEFDDFTSERVFERPGEQILGYATTHMQYRSGYTMRMSVLGMRQESRTDVEQEIWCTDAIDAAGFNVWLRPDRFRTGNADIDRLIEQQYADVDCLPLRNRMVTTTTSGGRGRSSTVTSLTEVTALREDTPDAGTFDLPAGYETVPLLALPAGADFGAEREDAAAEDEPEQPRRRPRLRDLIGR